MEFGYTCRVAMFVECSGQIKYGGFFFLLVNGIKISFDFYENKCVLNEKIRPSVSFFTFCKPLAVYTYSGQKKNTKGELRILVRQK